MPSSLKNDIVLVRYPFSDLSGATVRPAAVVSAAHSAQDIFIVPLTSKTIGWQNRNKDESRKDVVRPFDSAHGLEDLEG